MTEFSIFAPITHTHFIPAIFICSAFGSEGPREYAGEGADGRETLFIVNSGPLAQ